jgi:bifunctional DNase/RNase
MIRADGPEGSDGAEGADGAGGSVGAEGAAGQESTADPQPTPTAVMGDFRMALVTSVTVDLPNQYPTVLLRETESPRRQLSFSIAMPDAVVLSHALRRIATPRPLTHELMTGILQAFDIDVVAVRLVGRRGSVYFAELDLRGRTGRSVHSCRPSDALTLALQQAVPVPILIDRRLFEETGDVASPGPSSPAG